MTLLPSDEPQTVEESADLAPEIPVEQIAVDVEQPPQELATDTIAPATEFSPIEPHAVAPDAEEPLLFANVFQHEPPLPERIPHLGHVALLALYLVLSVFATAVVFKIAAYFRLIHITSPQAGINDIHYALGSEVLIYLGAFVAAFLTFPLIWRKSFFAGVQWNGSAAVRRRLSLVGTGFMCYVAAIVNLVIFPGPSNTPIEKVFKEPGAAWLLFIFGVTVAPFFEELCYRGFLLPALCTACDWLAEKFLDAPRRPLAADGGPQWSMSAMVIASLVTSAPFALMHAEQTGNSVDAVVLLAGVSLVLCAVRLVTRSLAASVLVHAFYNFLLFSMMLLGTQGFKHFQ